MNVRAAALLLALFVIPAAGCAVRGPDIVLPEVPSGDLVRALEQRRQDFPGMKALAAVRVERKDRERVFDNVGILLESYRRFRMEAFGPFGESLLALAWDGSELRILLAGEAEPVRVGQSGLDRILGTGIQPADLCAIMSGNIPAGSGEETIKAYCGDGGLCVVEFQSGDLSRRAWLTAPGPDRHAFLGRYEVHRYGRLVYQVRFEDPREVSHYVLPGRIVVENPERQALLAVDFSEMELFDQFPADLFSMTSSEAQAQ